MTRIRIDLAYDGAGFHGFARQPDVVTVEGELRGALRRLLGTVPDTVCAGRTDAGVHALAQVVHVDVDDDAGRGRRFLADLADTRSRIDSMVGPAITIWRLRRVSEEFHARFSATERSYRYRLLDAALADPLERHRRLPVGEALDAEAMGAALAPLRGEHDFASFCRSSSGRHTVRTLGHARVRRRSEVRVDVELRGRAFCHQQVRSIVGCLIEIGAGRREPGWLREVLEARDRDAAAAVAAPHGLVLEAVSYGGSWPAAPPEGASIGGLRTAGGTG